MKDITPRQIKKLRFDCYISQIDFSRSIHVSQQLVAAWENGTRRPSEYHAMVLRRIKRYLDDTRDTEDQRLLFHALRRSSSMRGLEKLLTLLFREPHSKGKS